jgi:23S rRNA pseudouridine955/2504/2580 synthase/23S rRNA pseudouridine1911/1915/1917 synthase
MQLSSLILAETDHWIALNKPAGLLSVPDRLGKEVSLKMMLREKYGNSWVVHRLDRETSGVILFAKDETTHQLLNKQFEERRTEKIYTGLVVGTPAEEQGSITTPIAEHPAGDGRMMTHAKGKPSHTDYRVLELLRPYSLVEFIIHTGRTHQIRVHLQSLGHPIVCDTLYGDGKPVLVSSLRKKFKLSKLAEEERPILARLALHARRLSFVDNADQPQHIEAPLPKDLTATLSQLRKAQVKK